MCDTAVVSLNNPTASHNINNRKMHFNIYDIFYFHCPHKHVLDGIPAIFAVTLQEYKHTNLVNCVTITSK